MRSINTGYGSLSDFRSSRSGSVVGNSQSSQRSTVLQSMKSSSPTLDISSLPKTESTLPPLLGVISGDPDRLGYTPCNTPRRFPLSSRNVVFPIPQSEGNASFKVDSKKIDDCVNYNGFPENVNPPHNSPEEKAKDTPVSGTVTRFSRIIEGFKATEKYPDYTTYSYSGGKMTLINPDGVMHELVARRLDEFGYLEAALESRIEPLDLNSAPAPNGVNIHIERGQDNPFG